jgi:hypothetical protein
MDNKKLQRLHRVPHDRLAAPECKLLGQRLPGSQALAGSDDNARCVREIGGGSHGECR